MATHYIRHYPVDNGDTTLITLGNGTTILIDCKIRDGEENADKNKIYDVKKDLMNMVQRRANNPYLDLFILTHPDQDHCAGFQKNFYCGDPKKYSDVNRKNQEIIVEELWATSMLFEKPSNDDWKSVKKEAERRRGLWDASSADKDDPGNRLRLIGYDGNEKFENVPSSIPGEEITMINGKTAKDFSFFVHAPFKASLVASKAEEDNNSSSIIMQARFKVNSNDSEWACLFLFGGDADHYIWEQVLGKSKKYSNSDKLKWDIFIAPHHCSWTYFNNVPYGANEENKKPKAYSLELLGSNYKMKGARIIASSKSIKNNDDNPPHYQAKQQYLKKLDSANDFLELAIIPKESAPKPIVFKITPKGPVREDELNQGSALASAGGSLSTINKKSEYGTSVQ